MRYQYVLPLLISLTTAQTPLFDVNVVQFEGATHPTSQSVGVKLNSAPSGSLTFGVSTNLGRTGVCAVSVSYP
jgi:hypothetical protein